MGFTIKNGVLKNYTEKKGVTEVVIHDLVNEIGYYAFSGCVNLTIYASENSYAIKYAKKYRMSYSVI